MNLHAVVVYDSDDTSRHFQKDIHKWSMFKKIPPLRTE